MSSSNNTFTPDYDGIYSIAVTLAIERNEGGFFNLDVMEEVSAGADIILDQISKRTDGGTVSTETYNFMLNLEAGTDYYLRVNSHSSTQAVTGIMSNGEVMINKIN